MNYMVDTNVLVRLRDKHHPLSSTCHNVLAESLRRSHVPMGAAQILIEFWSVATRPLLANGLGLTALEAEAAVTEIQKYLIFLDEPADVFGRWYDLVRKHCVLGKQAHDARIVAFMNAHGIDTILTLNANDFKRFNGIRVLDPATFLELLKSSPG